jgi:hypothetical protein
MAHARRTLARLALTGRRQSHRGEIEFTAADMPWASFWSIAATLVLLLRPLLKTFFWL